MTHTERLQQALFGADSPVRADGALITSAPNCRYLSGFPSSSRTMLVTKEQTYFLTDFRYAEAARKTIRHCKVVEYKNLAVSLKELLRRHEIRTLLLEYDNLSYGESVRYRKLCEEAGAEPVLDRTLDTVLMEFRLICPNRIVIVFSKYPPVY